MIADIILVATATAWLLLLFVVMLVGGPPVDEWTMLIRLTHLGPICSI